MIFSERVKKLRNDRGITQSELGEIVGVTLKQIQRYEAGTSEPTMSKLQSLADCFDVPLDYLVGRGLFSNWEDILKHKDTILSLLDKTIPGIVELFSLNAISERALMWGLAAIIDHVDVDESGMTVYFHSDLSPSVQVSNTP